METNNIIKSIKKIAWSIIDACGVVFPIIDIWKIKRYVRRRGNTLLICVPCSIKKYCDTHNDEYHVVEKAQKRIVFEPAFFEQSECEEHYCEAKEIYVAELKDVVIHGGTGLITAEDIVLTDVCENDTENRVLYTFGKILRGSRKAFYIEVCSEIDEMDTVINLCGLASFNYYHLTFEILSRFEYIKDRIDKDNVTVLLDESAGKYSQYRDLIHAVIGNAKVRYVKETERVFCRKVIYPSMNTWMPMNVRKKDLFRISDNLIAESAILNIKKATEKYRKKRTGKRVFVSRKNTEYSRISNEDEVVKLFKKAGFEVACTEELSFQQQIELFSSASCIVGASGAALTNLVYCNPGTVFGCIIPREYRFCIYSSIAYMMGCNVLFLDAEIVKADKYISTEQCKVDLDVCNRYIIQLSSMIEKED